MTPMEYVWLKDKEAIYRDCPHCFEPFSPFMRGQVQSFWRRLFGLAYCCVICARCKQIVGYEKP